MGMPETPMKENDCLVFGKYDIRLAGQAFIVDPKAETVAEKMASDQYFRLGILCFDARHDPASRFQRKTVTQLQTLPRG